MNNSTPENPSQGSRSGTASVVLASVYHSILEDLLVSPSRLESLAGQAVPIIASITKPKNTSSIKSKLVEEITKPSMTWKVFLKGLAVLRAKAVEINFIIDVPEKVQVDPSYLDSNGALRVGFQMEIPQSFLAKVKDVHPGRPLAETFRKLCLRFGYIGDAFNARMSEHIRNSTARDNTDSKKTSDRRNNDKKELLGDSHTYDVFIKGLSFLGVESHVFELIITHRNGTRTIHSRRIDLA